MRYEKQQLFNQLMAQEKRSALLVPQIQKKYRYF